jgi:hypothetical protein
VEDRPWKDLLWPLGLIAISLLVTYLGITIHLPSAPELFRWLSQSIGVQSAHIGIWLFVCVIGVAAHTFKLVNKFRYGITEIAFGVISSGVIVFRISPNDSVFSQWAALVGCAYVIARGMNNAFGE